LIYISTLNIYLVVLNSLKRVIFRKENIMYTTIEFQNKIAGKDT